ncbi:putative glutathione-dependent formaldehyde-activating enzyme [Penicillium chrysogenum]|uniref:Putative glutathione-dependent formaldehyde-activating enzyme n=1 Tax=Penicillium chrysogenum TaxID=5076 RepID=A0A162BDE7_PENCH|nr:putative glutathione-dependent formaldehyde-activating enzyme [Penicillium chrysogenum]
MILIGPIGTSKEAANAAALNLLFSPKRQFPTSYVLAASAARKYSAVKDRGTPDEQRCSSERNFCSNCSTMLWLWDHHWPELIHPFASAIDTELPVPDEMVCIMDGSKPAWARWPEGKKNVHEVYGEESLEGWHKKHGLFFE